MEDRRKHERTTWEFAKPRCDVIIDEARTYATVVDSSERGLRLETPIPLLVSVGTMITIEQDGKRVNGTVRHHSVTGFTTRIGVELCG